MSTTWGQTIGTYRLGQHVTRAWSVSISHISNNTILKPSQYMLKKVYAADKGQLKDIKT